MRGTWGTQGFCLDYEISWTQHQAEFNQSTASAMGVRADTPRTPFTRVRYVC
jgi:hypothetical protein